MPLRARVEAALTTRTHALILAPLEEVDVRVAILSAAPKNASVFWIGPVEAFMPTKLLAGALRSDLVFHLYQPEGLPSAVGQRLAAVDPGPSLLVVEAGGHWLGRPGPASSWMQAWAPHANMVWAFAESIEPPPCPPGVDVQAWRETHLAAVLTDLGVSVIPVRSQMMPYVISVGWAERTARFQEAFSAVLTAPPDELLPPFVEEDSADDKS